MVDLIVADELELIKSSGVFIPKICVKLTKLNNQSTSLRPFFLINLASTFDVSEILIFSVEKIHQFIRFISIFANKFRHIRR